MHPRLFTMLVLTSLAWSCSNNEHTTSVDPGRLTPITERAAFAAPG